MYVNGTVPVSLLVQTTIKALNSKDSHNLIKLFSVSIVSQTENCFVCRVEKSPEHF